VKIAPTRIIGVGVLVAAVALWVATALRPTDQAPLRMGFQVCNSPAENRRRFTPLVAYLERELGRKIEAVHLDTSEFLDPAHQHYDLYHVNSLIYVNLKAAGAAEVVAGELQGEGGPNTRGLIIARKDSGIRTVQDLKGKRLIFGPMLSPGGYLTQYYAMMKAGLDPERDLGIYSFPPGAWKHEKVVYAVQYGAADAGAARYDDLDIMAKDFKIDPKDFVVLHTSPWVPWCTVAVSPKLPSDLRNRFEKALLRLKPGVTAAVGNERLDVLRWGEINGFAAAREADYDLVREMAREVRLPPYE